jgi:transporter family protein
MGQSWLVFALASAGFAALTAIFGKLGVSGLNSDLATFFRTIVVLGVSAGVVSLRGGWQAPARQSAGAIACLVLSGIATGLSWLCYYRALQLGPASRVAPIDKLSVVIVVLLSAVALRETVGWQVWVGVALIAAGAIVVSTAR